MTLVEQLRREFTRTDAFLAGMLCGGALVTLAFWLGVLSR